jgi:hypothetical protein
MTQVINNLGSGGAALNAQNGSSTSADTNDALFLDWPGDNAGNYVYTTGVADNFLSVPDEAALDITGDIDLRVYAALDSWASGSLQGLVGKYLTTGNQRSYSLRLTSTGVLRLTHSPDGTAVVSTESTAATGLADGEAKWVRATLDVDNGASGFDVQFFTSNDGATWTQLGSTVTTAGVTSIFSSTALGSIGRFHSSVELTAGKIYRAQILNGIGGTTVLDVDTSVITSGSATTFTALTSQTVTIGRATSGRKTVAVVSPVWLFGTDDYMEVADDDLLDFGATDSFTLIAVHRPWATQGTNDTLIAKKANTTNTTAGYNLSGGSSTALQGQSQNGDGTAGITAVSGSRTSGNLTVTIAIRNVATDTLTVYLNNSAGTSVTDTTTGSLSNAEVLRIARLSGAGTEYADMELVSVAVGRRAISLNEIASIVSYYQNRLS